MGPDILEMALGICVLVWIVSALLYLWASNNLMIRLLNRHAEVWRGLGGSTAGAADARDTGIWMGLRLFVFVLAGRYRNSDDPVVRRNGAIGRYSAFAWTGSVSVLLIPILWAVMI